MRCRVPIARTLSAIVDQLIAIFSDPGKATIPIRDEPKSRIRGKSSRRMYVIDYHNFTNAETSQSRRDELGVGDLYINAARCFGCNVTVRSCNRHDFRYCKCGNVAVDGGSWYAKRVFKEDGPGFENIVVPFNDTTGE